MSGFGVNVTLPSVIESIEELGTNYKINDY